MPDKWNIELIWPLHKKEDDMRCSNCNEITLINTAYNILSYIVSGHAWSKLVAL